MRYYIILRLVEEVYFLCFCILDSVNCFIMPIQYVKICFLLLWSNHTYYIVLFRKKWGKSSMLEWIVAFFICESESSFWFWHTEQIHQDFRRLTKEQSIFFNIGFFSLLFSSFLNYLSENTDIYFELEILFSWLVVPLYA